MTIPCFHLLINKLKKVNSSYNQTKMKKFKTGEDCKCRLNSVKLMSLFLVFSLVFWLFTMLRDPLSDGLWAIAQPRDLYFKFHKAIVGENDGVEMEKDKLLLGGLLPSGMDEESCLSRYELPLYWRGDARRPSPRLISKLRSYEARHRRCGPHTRSYNETAHLLQSNSTQEFDCKYIVWISSEGLGNKMLSLASAFLYALLTDRVLLVDRGADIPDLFCEPFPEASWFLPSDFAFPHRVSAFNQHSNYSYGNRLRANSSVASAPYMYLYLAHNCDDQDQLFFCDQHQTHLHDIPWLMMKTDQYIAPMFFLMPSFQQELHALFPEKETVFHLLGRYLFRPTNSVWGLVTRFYESYLSKADVIAGIQVRLFSRNVPFSVDQILTCTKRENILPQISQRSINKATAAVAGANYVAVLMVSLSSSYFERVREVYWENGTEKGEVVGVFQPSHEEYQQTGKPSHDRKALAEIYLLSLAERDKLVTTSFSTFGYVAQALGGVKPWLLYTPTSKNVPDPPCGRSLSMEPCYHRPPHLDCKTRRKMDMGGVVAHVRHCEGFSQGIKLF